MNIPSLVIASRMTAQERAIEVSASNLANLNTPGFQASRTQFADWLSPPRAGMPRGEPRIAFAQDRATWRDTAPGTLTQTGHPFDLALRGGGYFTVATPRGPRLTRNGDFTLLADGRVGDGAGNALLDVNGKPIQTGPDDANIVVASDGSVSSDNGQLGQIGVVTPGDPAKLRAEGKSLFRADTPTKPRPDPDVAQGMIEGSNVSPITELTTIMREQRDFQLTAQFLQAEDDRVQSVIEKLAAPMN